MTASSSKPSLLGAVFAAVVSCAGVPSAVAQQGDYDRCIAERYDRLRTEADIAETIGACARVIAAPALPAPQRARALYFRGLNYFLDAVRLAIAEAQPVSSGSAAVRRAVDLALDDLGICIALAGDQGAPALGLRATIFTALERDDAARRDLDQAIRLDPKTSSLFVQRALLSERADRFDEARADLDDALAIDPKNQNGWITRAALWARYGDVDQALADFNRAEEVGGTQTWNALSGRAKLAVRIGEPLRAFRDWTKAAEVAPLSNLSAQFYVRAGNLARDYLKEPDRAALSYRRALDAHPNYADAMIQRGLSHERGNRSSDALADYRKAMELTRDNPLDKALHDYARYRLEVLQNRMSRKAGEAPLPPNINILTRTGSRVARDRTRRIALVIGNAAYRKVAPLMNADRDAETVAEALSEAGFGRVTVATDADKAQMEDLLKQFSRDAAQSDWAVIYFAGHGIESGSRNFLVPVDTGLDALRDAPAHAVAVEQIVEAANTAQKLRLVALDACRDNPFVQEANRVAAKNRTAVAGTVPAERREIGGGFAGFDPPSVNTVVLYATQPGRVALDGDELNSPFARAFVKNLPVPGLALQAFLERVRDDVARSTERRQQPAVQGRLDDAETFSFFPL